MATPKLQANGKYRLREFVAVDPVTGKQIIKSFTADTPGACEKLYKAWLRSGGKAEMTPKGPTVRQALEKYIERCRNGVRKKYSPSTLRGYVQIASTMAGDLLDMMVERISISDIQAYIDQRDLVVVAKTIRNEIYLLRPALRLAGRSDLDFTLLEFPEQEKEDYIIPTDEEVQQLLRASSKDDKLYLAIVLAALMGLRRSEICALKWGDIDRQQKIMHIRRAVVLDEWNTYQEKATKTKAGKRDLVIPDDILKEMVRRRGSADPEASLIDLTPSALEDRWLKLKTSLGFDFVFHGLRHYHASVMVALGIPKGYAAENMGHSSYDMIERVYGQIVREKERTTNRMISAHAETILSGESFDWGKKLTIDLTDKRQAQ